MNCQKRVHGFNSVTSYIDKIKQNKTEYNIISDEKENINDSQNQIKTFEFENDGNSFRKYVSNRLLSQGLTKIVDMGMTTKKVGNSIITTKTTQISLKRKKKEISENSKC